MNPHPLNSPGLAVVDGQLSWLIPTEDRETLGSALARALAVPEDELRALRDRHAPAAKDDA